GHLEQQPTLVLPKPDGQAGAGFSVLRGILQRLQTAEVHGRLDLWEIAPDVSSNQLGRKDRPTRRRGQTSSSPRSTACSPASMPRPTGTGSRRSTPLLAILAPPRIGGRRRCIAPGSAPATPSLPVGGQVGAFLSPFPCGPSLGNPEY